MHQVERYKQITDGEPYGKRLKFWIRGGVRLLQFLLQHRKCRLELVEQKMKFISVFKKRVFHGFSLQRQR